MSHVSDNILPHDSVSNAGSGSSRASSRASRAKITSLRIKAEFQQKRSQQQLDAESQQLEADLRIERQHREAQLQASYRERELAQLSIQEELAIAVAEDTIMNEPEDSVLLRPPQLLEELSSPPHGAAEKILSEPHLTLLPKAPEISFNTDCDIVNNMPPFPNNDRGFQNTLASTPQANSAIILTDAIQKMATLSQHAKLPSAEVQVFNGDPCSYQRFLSSFRYVVETNTSDPSARLNLLIQYTSGQARKVIEDCVLLPPEQGYIQAKELLRKNFGNPHKIAQKHIDSLISGKPIPPNATEPLVNFSRELEKARITLTSLNYTADINATSNLKLMANRLPTHLQSRWSYKAHQISNDDQNPRQVSFSDFSDFVWQHAQVATSSFGLKTETLRDGGYKSFDRSFRNRTALATQAVESESTQPTNSIHPENARKEFNCFVCHHSHPLYRCETFIKMPLNERSQVVKENRRCFNCFRSHHIRDCNSRARCQECGYKHHTLLHDPNRFRDVVKNPSKTTPPAPASTNTTVAATASKGLVFLRILPVQVLCGNKTIHTLAMLDDGSQTTLCSESLIRRLNAPSRLSLLTFTTMSGQTKIKKSRVLDLKVSACGHTDFIQVDGVQSLPTLPISTDAAAHLYENDYEHLSDVIDKIQSDCFNSGISPSHPVELLIGGNVPEVFWVDEERRGKQNQPFAQLTKLGWTVQGASLKTTSTTPSVNFIQEDCVQHLNRIWETDFPERQHSDVTSPSIEDKIALKFVEENTSKQGNHFQIGMPWRTEKNNIPNNKLVAEKRLVYLKRKLQSNSDLHSKYTCAIQDYLDSGYATSLPHDAPDPPTGVWYIPHHGVLNPNKPKLRVVFDCAASFQGKSLNDHLYQGPDLMSSLVGILARFREKQIALVADIKAMFSQVLVQPSDQDLQRFLWFPDGNLDRPVERYAMTRHVFGVTSSPFVAAYALQETASQTQETLAKQAIKSDFYVDDLLT